MGRIEKVLIFVNIIFLLAILGAGLSKSKAISDFRDYYRASALISQRADIYQYEEIKSLQNQYTIEDVLKNPELFSKLESMKGNLASYIYPPTFAFLLIPLTFLSYENASLIFFLLNFSCLLGSLYLMRNLLYPSRFTYVLFSALLFSFRFLENHANNNQVAFILFFLILYSLHTTKKFFAGIALSLAIIIKLTPLIFILYFFYKKKFKILIYTLLGLIFWGILPLLIDIEYGITNWQNWFEMVLLNVMKNPIFRAWKNNQSLIGTLAKYFLEGADPLNQAIFKMPFAYLSVASVKMLFNFLVLLILFPLFYRYRKGIDSPQHISALFILSVIFSGISWIHTFSFFVFPIGYLYKRISERKGTNWKKIIFFTLGFLIIITGKSIGGQIIDSISLMYSLLLYIGLGFYFLVLSLQPKES